MKSLWNSFKAAFAMFSKIPMPQADWSEENIKYMLCFFPFIGTVIGAVFWLVWFGGMWLGMGDAFLAVCLVLLPVVITGGIHVDGLLDTSDAMSSWQERSRRLEILKDSNAGAFAVITACVYFLAWYGGVSQLLYDRRGILLLSLGFMVSRCLSGIGVVTFPKARADGTVAEFSRKAQDKAVRNTLIVYLALLLVIMVWISPVKGVCAFAMALLVFGSYHHMAMKYFGGTTGDLSGCFLCLCEVGMALVLAVVSLFPV